MDLKNENVDFCLFCCCLILFHRGSIIEKKIQLPNYYFCVCVCVCNKQIQPVHDFFMGPCILYNHHPHQHHHHGQTMDEHKRKIK